MQLNVGTNYLFCINSTRESISSKKKLLYINSELNDVEGSLYLKELNPLIHLSLLYLFDFSSWKFSDFDGQALSRLSKLDFDIAIVRSTW